MKRKTRHRGHGLGQSNQKPNPAYSADNPAAGKKSQPDKPNAQRVTREDEHSPNAVIKCYDTGEQEKGWYDHALLTFTAITAAGGLFASIAAGYQGYIARESEIVSNRAFVLSNSLRFIAYGDATDANREWRISPVIENVGNTQTVNLRFNINVGICAAAFPTEEGVDKYINDAIHKKNVSGRGIIGPKSDAEGSSISLKNVSIDCPIVFSSIGVIRYKDIFGGDHITEFCNAIASGRFTDFRSYPGAQYIKVQTTACPHHNCADDECGPGWRERAKE